MKNFLMSLLWVALFAGLGAMYWFQTTFDSRLISMNERAGAIEEKYRGFTDRIHALEVQFEGRAKHVRQNQVGIKDLNTQLGEFRTIHSNDMYAVNSRVDSLGGIVDNDRSNNESMFEAQKKTITSIQQKMTQDNILVNQKLNKLDRDLTALQKKVDEVELKMPQEAKDTKKK